MIWILTFSSQADKDKFEWIYHKYKNLMMHKAYGILHDHMLAEDAVSEAMLRIYRNLDKIESPETGRSIAFMITIVKNTALSLLEKEQGWPSDVLEETQQDSFHLENHILAELSSREIYHVVDQLGEEAKSVFLLRYAHDLSHKEIGEMLGLTENNVTVKLHRAKKKLAGLLVKEGFAGEQRL